MLTHKHIFLIFDIAKFPQVRNHDSLITLATPVLHRIDAQYLVLTDRHRKQNFF